MPLPPFIITGSYGVHRSYKKVRRYFKHDIKAAPFTFVLGAQYVLLKPSSKGILYGLAAVEFRNGFFIYH